MVRVPMGLLSAALAACAAFGGAASAQTLDPFSARLLAAQNRERASVNVGPMTWDPQLAAAALSYGPALSALGQLQHSPKQSRPGQRENLWMGTTGAFSPEQMVKTWTDERRFYRPGIYPDVSTSGNWLDVSHWTTLVWPTTTRVGCAVYRARGFDYLICRYSPPGNIDGQPLMLPQRGERG